LSIIVVGDVWRANVWHRPVDAGIEAEESLQRCSLHLEVVLEMATDFETANKRIRCLLGEARGRAPPHPPASGAPTNSFLDLLLSGR